MWNFAPPPGARLTSPGTNLWCGHTQIDRRCAIHDARHGRRDGIQTGRRSSPFRRRAEDRAIIEEHFENDSPDQSDTIGGRIARAREAAGLSVAQAARRLGVKTITWQGWENDRAEPRSNKLTLIAGTLGVTPTWLLTGFGEGPSEGMDDEVNLLLQEVRLIARDVAAAQGRLDAVMRRLETFHSYHHVEPN